MSRCTVIKNNCTTCCTDLSRWDIIRHSFQHRDIVALDVQNTKHRTALTNQSLSPVLIEDKLLPLESKKETCNNLA